MTPATAVTAAVTSRLMVSLRGHPATVSSTWTETAPSSATSTESTMPSSVMGRLISGSLTPARASMTCCCVGVLMMDESTSRLGPPAARAPVLVSSSMSFIRPRSSERRKSRVATSPTDIRSEATSRARNSMSAWARALACRSCSATTLSRISCRFCASRMSGAAYDAWRLSMSVRKMKGNGSKRRSAGARAFHVTQTITKSVM